MTITVLPKPAWALLECREDGSNAGPISLNCSPFVLGRTSPVTLCIPSTSVSKQHAEILVDTEGLTVRDLGSTNGTFVNGHRINRSRLREGDLLQLATTVFRVQRNSAQEVTGTVEEFDAPWPLTLLRFEQLMAQSHLDSHFQPIVTMSDRKPVAFELLARSSLEGLETPAQMFGIAAQLGEEVALSELLRRQGAEDGESFGGVTIFMNTHPLEVGQPRLIRSLEDLRRLAPNLPIVVEIHEGAISAPSFMRELSAALKDLGMLLAYDDFGAGQARLQELAEVPPDYVKFDRQLISNIDQAAPRRQDLLRCLSRMIHDAGIQLVAEGVETEGEHTVCQQMGFDLAQGYLYARPAPVDAAKRWLSLPGQTDLRGVALGSGADDLWQGRA